MHFGQPGDDDPRRTPGERMARGLRAFPRPIAVLRDPPSGSQVLMGFEDENGQPFSIHLTYLAPDGQKLLVRTKPVPPPPDPNFPPPFVTVDTLQTAFGIYGFLLPGGPPPHGLTESEHALWRADRIMQRHRSVADYESMARHPVSVPIDGTTVAGLRIDYPDRSGVELDWDGRTVQCVGTNAAIDDLALCTASEEDLASFVRWPRPTA
jgi:hypothetical protein